MSYTYSVPDMNCGHCQKRIETALKDSGITASYTVDLAGKKVTVESDRPADAVAAVITDAGYTPTLD